MSSTLLRRQKDQTAQCKRSLSSAKDVQPSQHLKLTAVDRPVKLPARSLLTRSQWQSIAKSLHLSGRECQIVRAIFEGHKETAIAHKLGISPHTVHAYVRRIYGKLDVNCHCELLLCIFEVYLGLPRAI